MKVLVACEFSGVVRRAFRSVGCDAWSCDLEPSEDNSLYHIQGDVLPLLWDYWDLLIAHPTCTRLTNAGVRWLTTPPPGKTLEQMWEELEQGVELFSQLWNAPIKRIAVENPVMNPHAKARIENYQPPSQTVQPWWFGEPAFKATSLYLRNLPVLEETNRLIPPEKGTDEHKRWSFIHRASPGPNRWKVRSRTFEGIAKAMAEQWSVYDG